MHTIIVIFKFKKNEIVLFLTNSIETHKSDSLTYKMNDILSKSSMGKFNAFCTASLYC